VGTRVFHQTGELAYERPLKNGLTHGIVYRCDIPGKVLSAEPCVNGLRHGIARQYNDQEELLGSYSMKRGTGLDLWWGEYDGKRVLYETRYFKDGILHGFEWWLAGDTKRIWRERHFWKGKGHGIERSWNFEGRLRRGFTRYWIEGRRVTKRRYVRESSKDPALPKFRDSDNRPQRKLPPEVMASLGELVRRSRAG